MKNRIIEYFSIGREATIAYLICLGFYFPLQLALPGWLQYIAIIFFLVIWDRIRFYRTREEIVISLTGKMKATISTEASLADLQAVNEAWGETPPERDPRNGQEDDNDNGNI